MDRESRSMNKRIEKSYCFEGEIGMTAQVRLIALDVDGTLLNDDHEVLPQTKKMICDLQQQGIKVVLATGRGPRSCTHLVELLNLQGPIIAHNGAVIYEPHTHKIRLELGYQANELLPIIQYCRSKEIQFDLSTALEMYIEGKTPEAEELYTLFRVDPMLVPDSSLLAEQIVKFTMFGSPEELDKAMEELNEQLPDWRLIRSGDVFIDIIHPQATKGYALQQVIEEYGLQPSEVLAFGNYFNDIEMLQLAGIGVAMDNSPDDVKKAADYVTGSNNDDGIAIFLTEFFNRR